MRVSIYGAGQVGTAVSGLLVERRGFEVQGPYRREDRRKALTGRADVVVIATTSFLKDVAADITMAVASGSNVLTTAEEAAYPWAVDRRIADDIDSLARQNGVSVIGRGLNPGFTFDALTATACGPCSRVRGIRVERVVDLSGFGRTVLRRIGVGFTADEFEAGVREGRITGHIGFPQSMALVAARLGLTIDKVEKTMTPIPAAGDAELAALTVRQGQSGGFEQYYQAYVGGAVWFTCKFTGHIALSEINIQPRDELWIEGDPPVHMAVTPGLNPQLATPALIANSLSSLVKARHGWITVVDLPPAAPD